MTDSRMQPFAGLDPSLYQLDSDFERRLPTPALVVFADLVRANIARVIELCGGGPGRWRPHLKTTKMPEVWSELFAAGVRQFKCATPLEARRLLETADRLGERADLLVAFPHVGPNLERLGSLARAHPEQRLSVLVESPDTARAAPAELGLAVDVNPGMDRTGIPMEDSDRFWATCEAAGERLGALHYYDGHEVGAYPARRERLHGGYERLLERYARLCERFDSVGELITCGSPAFQSAIEYAPLGQLARGVHRVSPGTVVFHDLRSELQDPQRGLRPAALIRASVISRPAPGRVTLDAGSKAIGADAGTPTAQVLGADGWLPKGPSEEHLPVDGVGSAGVELGTRLWLIPRHVCTTVNLARQVVLVEANGEARAIPVAAGGHSLEW